MLKKFVESFAKGIEIADSKKPQAVNARDKTIKYSPGIGSFQEKKLIKLVTDEMKILDKNFNDIELEVKYSNSRKKCDIAYGTKNKMYIEAKAMRRLRNNGSPEEFIMVDILSPYEGDGSVLGDIKKLLDSEFNGQKAIIIYGYTYDQWPLKIAIDCFETLAEKYFCNFKEKYRSDFDNLIHPYHKKGSVYGWLIEKKAK